jgi:hypothetical protein
MVMKKLFYFSTIFILSIALSGCFDIFQHITKDNSGADKNTIKVTLSKTVFEMISGFADSEVINYDELFEEDIDIEEYEQFHASINKINDTMEAGYLFDMTIDYRDRNMMNIINTTDASFIPKYTGKTIDIFIECLGESTDSIEDNEMAAAFLASGKYRLVISKKCAPNISRVVIETPEENTEIGYIDLFDDYLIEMPMPILFISDIDLKIYLR